MPRAQVSAAPTATLWVDDSTGNDGNTIAQVRAGGGSVQWKTIGRAVWGSADRATPSTTECAQPGDTVSVKGGASLGSPVLYTYAGTSSAPQRFDVLYNPAVTGTLGNPIRILADGYVKLAGPSWSGPAVGANGVSYVEWFANHRTGGFLIDCYALLTGSAASDELRVVPDTGPCVFTSATGCRVEGFRMDGGADPSWGDNYNAYRFDGAVSCVVKNCYATSFLMTPNTDNHSNGAAFYGSRDCIFEHNHIQACVGGIIFKDKDTTALQSGNYVRYNFFDNLTGQAIVFSHVTTNVSGGGENRNYVHSNLINGAFTGVRLIGNATAEGLLNDWIFNNTIANCTGEGLGPSYGTNTVGVRVWNNIIYNTIGAGARAVMASEGGTVMPAATIVSLDRNVYFSFTGFYEGSDGVKAFGPGAGTYLTVYSDQDQNSVNSDPLFVDAAGGNFHLQSGSPARGLGSDLGAGTDAGCFPYGGSVEVGLES